MIKRRPTIHDVARAAGVTAPVVSIVLNNRTDSTIGASPETRERVQRIARELNYKPNIMGRSLAGKKSYLLGLLLSHINSPLVSDVIRGVQEVAGERSYSPVVFIHNSPEQEAEELERSQDRQVDALIVDTFDVPACADNIKRYRQLADQGYPIVELFGNSIPDVSRVNVDFFGDGRRAVERLVELGHRRIALLTHDSYTQRKKHWASWKFVAGYQAGIDAAGLSSQMITAPAIEVPGDGQGFVQSGRHAAERLVALSEQPTALICYGNRRAHGLLHELNRRGIKVPEDISVVGFYERDITALTDPPVTSLVLDACRAGQAAAQMVFEMLESRNAANGVSEKREAIHTAREMAVPSEWIELESVRAMPK